MTDAQFKRYVIKCIKKWYNQLMDSRYLTHISFVTKETDKDDPARSGCMVDEDYNEILFYFNLDFWREHLEKYPKQRHEEIIEQEVIHEILHVPTWPAFRRLREAKVPEKEVKRLQESITTMLERGIWAAYKAFSA